MELLYDNELISNNTTHDATTDVMLLSLFIVNYFILDRAI